MIVGGHDTCPLHAFAASAYSAQHGAPRVYVSATITGALNRYVVLLSWLFAAQLLGRFGLKRYSRQIDCTMRANRWRNVSAGRRVVLVSRALLPRSTRLHPTLHCAHVKTWIGPGVGLGENLNGRSSGDVWMRSETGTRGEGGGGGPCIIENSFAHCGAIYIKH